MANRLKDNRILRMPLAGNALELAQGNNGTWGLNEAYSFDNAGRQIANFEGTTSYVQIPHNANQLLTNGFSISFKAKADTVGETAGRVIDKTTSGTAADGFHITQESTSTGNYVFRINAGTQIITTGLSLGKEYYLVLTVTSAGVAQWYVNGSPNATGNTGACSGITTTNAMRIGSESYGSPVGNIRCFDGLIGDVSIHNVALTAAEASELYLQSQQNFVSQRIKTALTAEYKLNGNALDGVGDNDLSWTGSSAYGLDTRSKYVAVCDGTKTLTNTTGLLTSKTFSISMLVRFDNLASMAKSFNVLFAQYGVGLTGRFLVSYEGLSKRITVSEGASTRSSMPFVPVQGQLYHIVVVSTSGSLFLTYANKTPFTSASAFVDIAPSVPNTIGNSVIASSSAYCSFGYVKIFNGTAITADEVKQLYRESQNPIRITRKNLAAGSTPPPGRATELIRTLDGVTDLSVNKIAITRTNATSKDKMVTFANGGLAWAATAAVGSFGYVYGSDFWIVSGANKYKNGAPTADAAPVTISTTGFSGVTATMTDIWSDSGTKTAEYAAWYYDHNKERI